MQTPTSTDRLISNSRAVRGQGPHQSGTWLILGDKTLLTFSRECELGRVLKWRGALVSEAVFYCVVGTPVFRYSVHHNHYRIDLDCFPELHIPHFIRIKNIYCARGE